MLVLSRKIGESLVIGDGIVVRVLSTDRGRVRIGLEAPANVAIRRSELAAATSSFPRGPRQALQNVPPIM